MVEFDLIKKGLILFVFIVANALSTKVYAQNKNDLWWSKNWVLRMGIGKTQFYGDASHDDKWEKLMTESRLNFAMSSSKQLTKEIAVGTEFFYSKVRSRKGENNMPVPVTYELASFYTEINTFFFIDWSALIFSDGVYHRFSFYSTMGIGYAFWNSELTSVRTGVKRHSGNTYDGIFYNSGGVVLPVIIGVKFNINYEWLIYADIQVRTITNDKLDVWKGNSPFDFLIDASIGVAYRLNIQKWSIKRGSKVNQRYLEKIYYQSH